MKAKTKLRKNATKTAATRKGATAKASKPKVTVKVKSKKGNIRSTEGYKAGFEAGFKKGQAAPDKGKNAEMPE